MKLAIVDDHPILRQGVATLLVRYWPELGVLHACNGEEAQALAATHRDLRVIVLDLLLPGEDGFALLAALRRARPDVAVVVLTSSEEAATPARAEALGAFACVTKSAGEFALPRAVGAALGLPLALPPALTPRQVDVLRLVAEGRSNKAVAAALDIAEKTVKAHLAAIFLALGADNRTHAIALARAARLIP